MATWRTVEEIGTALPETTVGTWYGKAALQIRDKGFLHLATDTDELSFPSPEKDELIASRPDVFSATAHQEGSPWLSVAVSKVSKEELSELMRDAWRMKAPRALREAHPEV